MNITSYCAKHESNTRGHPCALLYMIHLACVWDTRTETRQVNSSFPAFNLHAQIPHATQ